MNTLWMSEATAEEIQGEEEEGGKLKYSYQFS
jgi:hypothetical protein